MTRRLRRNTNNMYIILDGLHGSLVWRLKQGANIYVKSYISKSRCYDSSTTVMAVLSHFGNHNSRATAFLLGKLVCELSRFGFVRTREEHQLARSWLERLDTEIDPSTPPHGMDLSALRETPRPASSGTAAVAGPGARPDRLAGAADVLPAGGPDRHREVAPRLHDAGHGLGAGGRAVARGHAAAGRRA